MRVPFGLACCTGVSRGAARWARRLLSAKRLTALLLAFVIGFTPLSPLMLVAPLAPVTQAKADVSGELDQCLNTVKDVMDGAGNVASAASDPQYEACVGQAAAGDILDIAFMAAMTAFYVADTANNGGVGPFKNPAECNDFIKHGLLQMLAQQLEGLLSGTFNDILKSLIGQQGVDLLHAVAGDTDADKALADAIQGGLDDAETALWTALGPVTEYVTCGCEVAGTIAIVKETGQAVANDAQACGDILTHPGELLKAIWDDPGGVAKAALSAACEATEICPLGRDIIAGVKDVGGFLSTFVGGGAHGADCGSCDDPGLTTTCPTDGSFIADVSYNDGGWDHAATMGPPCACPPPYGRNYASQGGQNGSTCGTCGMYEGRGVDGFCSQCQLPMQQGADGLCSQVYVCDTGQDGRYNQAGGGCSYCPPTGSGLFQFWNPAGDQCWNKCQIGSTTDDPNLVNDPKTGVCVCKTGWIDIHDGKGCEPSVAATCGVSATGATDFDPTTNTCVTQCDDPTKVYVKQSSNSESPYVCRVCDTGTHKEGNTCVTDIVPIVCSGNNQIRTGDNTCLTCPDGTVPGFTAPGAPEVCASACGPGSQPRQHTALNAVMGAGNYSSVKMIDNMTDAARAALILSRIPGATGPGSDAVPVSSMSPQEERAAYDAAHHEGGSDNQCVVCGKNEYSVTAVIEGNGYFIDRSYCVTCPAGWVSNPGSEVCHRPFMLEVSRGPTAVRIPASYTPPTEKELVPGQPLSGKPLPVKPKACPRGEIQQKDGSCQVAKLHELQPSQGNSTTDTLKPDTSKYRPTLGPGIGVPANSTTTVGTQKPGLNATVGPGVMKPTLNATPGPGVVTPGGGLKATPGPGVVNPHYKP